MHREQALEMELEETPTPVDPEVRAYVYSLVSAVSQLTQVTFSVAEP